MLKYGVTEKGFVLKRLDTILNEIHGDLTEGFGVNTRLSEPSFLGVLVTTFAGQIADLWETAQDSYYAKYPATATGVNLDNSVQYGGIRRKPSSRTCYPLHCTGEDGTMVRENAMVATDTRPEVRLYAAEGFRITRESCNSARILVAAAQESVYTVTINGEAYSYRSDDGSEEGILNGLKEAITDQEYSISVENGILVLEDTRKERSNALALSENLTTKSVTTIANFFTERYGKVTLPDGIVSKLVNNIPGFDQVKNLLPPVYGRLRETDIQLRQSYLAKSGMRSNTMIESIVAELLNNVPGVESAVGFENNTEVTNSRGLPPHSVEIVAEGGDESEIAQAILRRKAGGIQTYGGVTVEVPGAYGDKIPVRFNRSEYLYTWLRVVLHGDPGRLPTNYVQLTVQSVTEDSAGLTAGTSLLTQLLTDGIYRAVAGITYIDIFTAYSTDPGYVPDLGDYQPKNVPATSRQKVLVDGERIEVVFDGGG